MGTQIAKRQIADGAIDDSKVQAGAGIQTSKLQEGVEFVKRSGSVPMTGALDMGNQKVINLQVGTLSTDAVTLGQMQTAISNLNSLFKSKPSARSSSTANIVISNPATAVFDGITLTVGQIVVLRFQTATAENGLYTFNGSGSALTRIPEMDNWTEVPGAFFAIEEGTLYADTLWLCTSNQGGTLGTTAITFQQIPTSAGLLNTNFVDKETPSGSINGVNVVFVLAFTPVLGSEELFLNGILQESGAGKDYTISAAVISFITAPLTGEVLKVSYRK
jgi:hypothetical protein